MMGRRLGHRHGYTWISLAAVVAVALISGGCATESDAGDAPVVDMAELFGSQDHDDDAPQAAEQSSVADAAWNDLDDGTGAEQDQQPRSSESEAGGGEDARHGTTPADATAATGAADGTGSLRWVDCPELLTNTEIQCVLVTVQVDPQDPALGTTEISAAVWPGDEQDTSGLPMAMLQGGPGGASTEMVDYYPAQPHPQVFIDQRGTGFGSADFDCFEIDEVIVASLTAFRRQAEAIELGAFTDCADRMKDHPLFAHTSTVAHAHDVITVMEALGHDSWLLYGVSYGTSVALEVLRVAPSGLEGVVLDGVVPRELNFVASVGATARRGLEEISEACADSLICASIHDDLAATMNEQVRELNDSPRRVPLNAADTMLEEALTVTLDGDLLAWLMFNLLYDETAIPLLPWLLAGLVEDEETIVTAVAGLAVNLLVLVTESTQEATYLAVQCSERVPSPAPLTVGMEPFVASVAENSLADVCEPAGLEASGPAQPVSSAVPTLLLSGRFDPITPHSHALQAARGLSNSTVVERDGLSHGIWASDDYCVDWITSQFVSDPSSPLDTSCADNSNPVSFIPP